MEDFLSVIPALVHRHPAQEYVPEKPKEKMRGTKIRNGEKKRGARFEDSPRLLEEAFSIPEKFKQADAEGESDALGTNR